MTELFNCELWNKTRALAKDYGYDMSENCPVSSKCIEPNCAFIDPITKLSQEEAINTELKLVALRKELKEHGGNI